MASTTKPAVGDSDGLEKLVDDICGAIGLNPDPIENFEPNLSSPAPEGR